METEKLKPFIQFFFGICNFSHKNDLFNDVQKCGILFGGAQHEHLHICTRKCSRGNGGMGKRCYVGREKRKQLSCVRNAVEILFIANAVAYYLAQWRLICVYTRNNNGNGKLHLPLSLPFSLPPARQ